MYLINSFLFFPCGVIIPCSAWFEIYFHIYNYRNKKIRLDFLEYRLFLNKIFKNETNF